MTDGEKIVQAAYKWLGTPHVNGAKVRGAGVDCGMLLLAATEDAGLIKRGKVKVAPYSNEWHLHHGEEVFKNYVEQWCYPVKEMEPGDFLLYQFGRCISHGAIYVGNGKVIHAYVDQGVVLTDLDDVMFFDAKGRSRLRGIYRYRKAVD